MSDREAHSPRGERLHIAVVLAVLALGIFSTVAAVGRLAAGAP